MNDKLFHIRLSITLRNLSRKVKDNLSSLSSRLLHFRTLTFAKGLLKSWILSSPHSQWRVVSEGSSAILTFQKVCRTQFQNTFSNICFHQSSKMSKNTFEINVGVVRSIKVYIFIQFNVFNICRFVNQKVLKLNTDHVH